MLKVSIVIPCYKVEEYLSRCLDSVRAQTLIDWEAICVDDGSPDKCGQIIDAYAQKDPRFKPVHQVNQGVSAARNAGIDAAQGKFLMFVDGDDWLQENALAELVWQAEATHADILMYGNICVYEDGSSASKKFRYQPSQANDFCYQVYKLGNCCTNKIFLTDFIKKHKLKFAKGVPVGEDGIFMAEAFLCKPKFSFWDRCFYNYRINRECSTTNSQYSLSQELKVRGYLDNADFYKNLADDKKIIIDIKVLSNLLYRYGLLAARQKRENLQYLQNYRFYLKQKYADKELRRFKDYLKLNRIVNNQGEETTWWQKIFSVKNSTNKQHKIIWLCGIKIYLKN